MSIRHRTVFKQSGRFAAVALASLAAASSAVAADPYFSGPSITRLATPALFSGRGFTPNLAVTVVISTPQNGYTASYGAVVGPDGALTYEIVPAVAGPYVVTVTDSGGRPLTKANFTAMQ